MSFFRKLFGAANSSLLCIGLDTDSTKLPHPYLRQAMEDYYEGNPPGIGEGRDTELEIHRALAQAEDLAHQVLFGFNKLIVDVTRGIPACYKLNLGFYLNQYVAGLKALKDTVAYIHDLGGLVILDGKFGDIGNSSEQYAHFAYEVIGADAVTVQPYLGRGGALEPFLSRGDKGVFMLCHTSNPGAGELQDVTVVTEKSQLSFAQRELPLYQLVAHRVAEEWNGNGNCGLVTGATYPKELATVRAIVGDNVPLLMPGIGAQEGELEQSVRCGVNSLGEGILINVSRGLLKGADDSNFAEVIAKNAREYYTQINNYRWKESS